MTRYGQIGWRMAAIAAFAGTAALAVILTRAPVGPDARPVFQRHQPRMPHVGA